MASKRSLVPQVIVCTFLLVAYIQASEEKTPEPYSASKESHVSEEEAKKKEADARRKAREAQEKAVDAVKEQGGRAEIDSTRRDVHPSPVVRVVINDSDVEARRRMRYG